MFDSAATRLRLCHQRLNYKAILISFFGFVFAVVVAAELKAKTYSESQIKVALVYKLMHFFEWPTNTPLNICVYKPNTEDVASFDLMPRQTESGSPVKVSLLYENGNSFKQGRCNIIFFSNDTGSDIQHILKNMTDDKRLTIGQTSQFIAQGGMINLVRKDLTIKFEINISALKRADLNISSQVLRIADQVYSEEGDD